MARLGLGGQTSLFDLIPLPLSIPSMPGEKSRDAWSQAKWRKWERLERENWKGEERRGRAGSWEAAGTDVVKEAEAWQRPKEGKPRVMAERGQGSEKALRGQKRRPRKGAHSGEWLMGRGTPT